MKLNPRHLTTRLALALLAGALTAISIAGVLCDRAYWLEVSGYRSIEAPPGTITNAPVSGVEISLYRSPGLSVLRTYYLPEDSREEFRHRASILQERLLDQHGHFDPPAVLLQRVAPWLQGGDFTLRLHGTRRSGNVIGAGWPWIYLWCEHNQPLVNRGVVNDALQYGFIRWERPGWVLLPSAAMHDEVLPLRPLPWRFIGAAVLWGLPWIALTIAADTVMRIRRTRRERKGVCAWCGYSQSGLSCLTCPECGNVRRK